MTSPQDFERLSTYLDNRLSAPEKARLEARLAREPELRTVLADLRQNARALRSLPVVKPPRNFTLSPKQAGAWAQPRPFYPVLRLATVFAAIALVVVFAGDFAASLAPTSRPVVSSAPYAERNAAQASAQPPAVAMMEAATTAAPSTGETTVQSQSGAATAAPGVLEQATGGGVGNTAGPAGAAPAAAATPSETPMPAAVLAAAPSAMTAETPPPAPAAKAAPALTPTAAAESQAQDSGVGASETSVSPTVPDEQAVPAAETLTSEVLASAQPAATPTPPVTPPLRYIEIGLLAVTLALAAITWLMRKR